MTRAVVAPSLWRHRDFMALWSGLTVSALGTQVSELALPLAAIATLHSGSLGVGVLRSLGTVPFLVIGLPVGAWIERRKRRPILISADVLRTVAVGSIPVAYAFGALTLVQLYVVAVVTGVGTVLFDVAYQSYLPRLVDRSQLVEGNTKLGLSQSVAEVGGPGFAGVLMRLLGPAPAVAVDAASFLASAVGVALIRTPEPPPAAAVDRAPLASEIRAGLRYVLGHRILGRVAGCTATVNFGVGMIDTVLLVFLARVLHLDAGRIGVVFLLGGTGVIAGALVAAPLSRRFGLGPSFVGTLVVSGVGGFLAPLAAGNPGGMWVVAASQWLLTFGAMAYNVNQLSLRQAVCPDAMQSRTNATMRFLVWGILPFGNMAGGVLGSAFGLRAALWASAAVAVVPVGWALLGPLRTLQGFPAQDPWPPGKIDHPPVPHRS